MTAAAEPLPEPVKRYTRIVDRLECPSCGARLGERWWDYRVNGWVETAYEDSGPTYYGGTVVGPKTRTFKPCGCRYIEPLASASPPTSGTAGEDDTRGASEHQEPRR